MDIVVIKEKFGNGEEYSLHLTGVGEDLFSGVIEYNHSTGSDEFNYKLNMSFICKVVLHCRVIS